MKTTFRPTEEQARGLEEIAAKCRVNKQDVMSWATDAIIAYFKSHKGRLLLPINFDQTFQVRPWPTETLILEEPPRRKALAKSK